MLLRVQVINQLCYRLVIHVHLHRLFALAGISCGVPTHNHVHAKALRQ